MPKENISNLRQTLWNIANEFWGKMSPDDYRDYILGFIFYKYLSEKILYFADNALKNDGIDYLSLKEDSPLIELLHQKSLNELGYFLKPSELFSEIAKKGSNGERILEELTSILNNIEQSTMGTESEDDFGDLFEDIDLSAKKLGNSEEQRNKLISKVLVNLEKINFSLESYEVDVIGDAYEYLIGEFAAGAGKKAGEFYTPQGVSIIIARIVSSGKSRLKSVYDPTCGSGSLLLRVAREVDDVSNFYGQELNRTTYNLARMNMILHDVHYRKFDIKQADTLENPMHLEHKFEAIVANPPFSANWEKNDLKLSDERFSSYGELAPRTKADFAFIQHMIHHLDENGTMAVVLPHGVLFRANAEYKIRKNLIDTKNCIDAVIGLPKNLFFGVGIEVCILVFKKCREDNENILFIDSSKEFIQVGNKNQLTTENIEKIVSTYQDRTTIEKYSNLVSLEEVKENDYNLNIPRYVDTFEEEDPIDIDQVSAELKDIDRQMAETDNIIASFCDELGIAKPF